MANEKKAGLLNASARDGVQYRKASLFQMIIGMANNGTGVIFYLILGFATLIGPQGYGITTVLTGILLTALRMVDGVSDAVVAAIFEKLNPKRGKIRIMLLVGWAVAALASLTLYGWLCGIFEGVLGVIAFSVAYILFDIGNTINGCAGRYRWYRYHKRSDPASYDQCDRNDLFLLCTDDLYQPDHVRDSAAA